MKKIGNINNEIYQKICAHLFFIFFTCIMLSPFIKGKTLYLYWIIPLIDIFYLKRLIEYKIRKELILLFLSLFVVLILNKNIEMILRIILIYYTIGYLFYLKQIKLFYLFYNYIFFNIFIAILQFSFNYINPKIAYLLGPTNIAKMIWKNLAGPAFTNFYSIGLLKRASGLSREVGFFASLIVITIILYIEDKNIEKKWWKNLLLITGFIISMSKMSLLLFIYFILKKIESWINKIPLLVSVILITFSLIFISYEMYKFNFFTHNNVTWTHRLGGYYVISHYKIEHLLFPLSDIERIYLNYPDISYLKDIIWLKTFTSISQIILHFGIIAYFLGIAIFKKFKITTYDFLILTLLTFNTGYVTVTSYVVLVYFYIFYKNIKNK